MKSAPRDISLVERQILIAKKNNKPKILAKLEKELADLKSITFVRNVSTPSKKLNIKVYDNSAAYLFYNS